MNLWRSAALLAATVSTGMMAGLFAAFAYAVMPGLARAGNRVLVVAMQRINESIQNGLFLLLFAGALVFTAIAAALHLGAGRRAALPGIIVALVLYVATLVITFAANIPLNTLLADGGDADPAGLRDRFEATWVRWNIVRTVTCSAAFVSLAWASLRHG
jgi:uncharacterized membrane protein